MKRILTKLNALAGLALVLWLSDVARAAATALPLVNLTDIPALPDGPGKGYYAVFHGKLFEVLVTTNLNALIHPLEGGKRAGPPIEIANAPANPSEKLRVVSIVKPSPPAVNPSRLAFDFVSDSGIHVLQMWKLCDGSLLVENQINNFLPERIPQLLIAVRFPKTHTVAANASQVERSMITAGCALRWRGGEGDNSLKVYTAPYANRVDLLGFCDWIEHRGPWGTRKITLKRTNTKGYFQPLDIKSAYEGLGLMFISRPDSHHKVERQGFELKVE